MSDQPENLEGQPRVKSPTITLAMTASQAATMDKKYLTTTKLYEGDLVVFRGGFHQDRMSPSFGRILPWGHPLTSNMRKEQKTKDSDRRLVEKGEKCIVQWESTRMLQLVQRKDLSLVDRQLRRGQAVRGLDGMEGVVSDVDVRMTIEILGSKSVVENVPKHRIYPFENIVRSQEILYRGWVGIVTSVQRNLNFRLGSGGMVSIPMNENDGFMSNDPYWVPGSYFPGQQVQLNSSMLKKGKIHDASIKAFFWNVPIINYIFALDSFTVLTPSVLGINVLWLCKNPFETKLSDQPPPEYLNAKMMTEVIPIGNPSCETLNNSSVRKYTLLPRETVKNFDSWFKSFSSRYSNQRKSGPNAEPVVPLKFKRSSKGDVVKVRVLLPQTNVEVKWEDGRTEVVTATSIPYITPLKEEAPHRAGLVVAKVFSGQPNGYKTYGIVTNKEADYKMVNVRWVVITADSPGEGAAQDLGIKEESVYDVKPHEEFSLYQKGTIVFLQPGAVKGIKAGTIVDLNLYKGKMLIANPGYQKQIGVWPHVVKPLSRRASWNFFTKGWLQQELVPPSYQIILPDKPMVESDPIRLSESNNNILDTLDSGLKNEPYFQTLDTVPPLHSFKNYAEGKPNIRRTAFGEEKELLKNKQEGIWIRAYEDRTDLLSILFLGPKDTPYEDGLYMFDVYLPSTYPQDPPKIKYISYSEEISPVIDHIDGEFCTGCLNWSSIDQDAPSIILLTAERLQSALFHREPFFDVYNIPMDTSAENVERSRAYNEKIFINVLSSYYNMMQRPVAPWRNQITAQMTVMLQHKLKFLKELRTNGPEAFSDRTYALFPVSKAFEKSLTDRIEKIEGLIQPSSKVLKVESAEPIKLKYTISKIQIQDISESKSDESANAANANENVGKFIRESESSSNDEDLEMEIIKKETIDNAKNKNILEDTELPEEEETA